MYDDYTDSPMLWCPYCSSYAFLDPGPFQKVLDIIDPGCHVNEKHSPDYEMYKQLPKQAKCKRNVWCYRCTKPVDEIPKPASQSLFSLLNAMQVLNSPHYIRKYQ